MKNLERARIKMEASEWNAAMQFLNWALDGGENPKEVLYYMCVCWLRMGQPEKALEVIEKALQRSPDDAMLLSERGVIYFHLGKKSLALLDMDKAVILEPKNPYRYASRAFIKDSLGDIEGAILDYEKAIELDPDDAIAYNNLGLLFEKQGYFEKAKKNFEQADKLSKLENQFLKVIPEQKQESKATKPLGTHASYGWKQYLSVIGKIFTDSTTRKEFWEYWAKRIRKH
ncbi:MAG: tetratricopeptide repeat protein [Flavobacteriales bacterium]|nr:tetratricopeptide repeat protein [Flavobacteriales bacterium]